LSNVGRQSDPSSGGLLLGTTVMYSGAQEVTAVPAKKKRQDMAASARTTRMSVSIPPDLYQTLQDIAKQKKVSVAWVIREAAEKYVEAQWPLFPKT
jgi:hypothetical protein